MDGARTHLDCNKDFRETYHELFDAALEAYNAKQTRADRHILDYYEKISSGKPEKLFHEIILQIGNCNDTGAISEFGRSLVMRWMNTIRASRLEIHINTGCSFITYSENETNTPRAIAAILISRSMSRCYNRFRSAVMRSNFRSK